MPDASNKEFIPVVILGVALILVFAYLQIWTLVYGLSYNFLLFAFLCVLNKIAKTREARNGSKTS